LETRHTYGKMGALALPPVYAVAF